MKRLGFYVIGVLTLCLLACNDGPKFKVSGTIIGAEGNTLYLEQSGIEGVISLDSVRIKENGYFKFNSVSPESPEFYRLRIGGKVINFSIDSTETVHVKSLLDNFSTGYIIDGSENSQKIKELALLQIGLQKKVDNLMEASRKNALSGIAFEDSLASLITSYKDTVKINYIFAAPNKPYAYYALFQQINGFMIFDPLNNKDDIKCFAAVATSLNNFYPHADRSKNLYNMVIKGMKNTRTPRQKTVEVPEVKEAGVIDIDLKDLKGNNHKLTDLKGKVVLLDFTVYQSAMSVSHNFALRDLYDKYADKGLAIYQVSFDADEHFWKTTTDNLPWICVRDPEGIYSQVAAIYNVKQLPTYFLINRNNELSARDESIKNLEEAIRKLL